MAISFTEATVGGKTKDAIVLSGSDDQAVVIFKEALGSFDLGVFEKINDFQILDEDEQPTLTTFKEKYDVFVLSNGVKASELYAPLERVVGDVDYIYKLFAASRLTPEEVLKIQEDLATCESGSENGDGENGSGGDGTGDGTGGDGSENGDGTGDGEGGDGSEDGGDGTGDGEGGDGEPGDGDENGGVE